MISQAEVRRLFYYDPETGNLIRRVGLKGVRIGDIAGTPDKNGYRVTMIRRKQYKNHRIIWLWHYGYLPEHDVDHINRDPGDNRIENLREISRSCNLRNQKVSYRSKSGITGVTRHGKVDTWVVRIKMRGEQIHLGCARDITDAAKLRWDAEVKYGWPSCNTTSSAYLHLREAGAI